MPDTLLCKSQDQLDEIAGRLLGKFPGSRIFAFYGSMGAGKTTFIKALTAKLGVADVVNSPTFAIVNEYRASDDSSVYHFDLYRLKTWQEMLDIGYEEYFYSGNYCLIEWPEKVENLLPANVVIVRIELSPEGEQRLFTF